MKIGDKVKIIDGGKCYSHYKEWIKIHGKKYLDNWEYGSRDFNKEDTYKIVAKTRHNDYDDMLYLIQNEKTKRVYIFGEEGIKKVKEKVAEDKLLKIINTYGVIPQLKHFQSEVWELNEAIFQYIAQKEACENIGCSRIHVDSCKKHIAEEIADCYVMLEQFRRYYKISSEEMVEIMKEKIDRQLTRIEGKMKNE